MSASQSTPPKDATEQKQELLEADRRFAADTARRRLEGWLAAFATGGAMLLADGTTIVGHEAIASVMGPAFSDPGFLLRWEPREARVLIEDDLGYTRGRYQRTRPGPGGTSVIQTGTYVTLWKKQPDGRWKVVFDTGSDEAERPVSD